MRVNLSAAGEDESFALALAEDKQGQRAGERGKVEIKRGGEDEESVGIEEWKRGIGMSI